jgi:hypothetical protein
MKNCWMTGAAVNWRGSKVTAALVGTRPIWLRGLALGILASAWPAVIAQTLRCCRSRVEA